MLTKRPLPQFAEFRAKTDDVLKIASEAAEAFRKELQ
jgi:hypothetical protein